MKKISIITASLLAPLFLSGATFSKLPTVSSSTHDTVNESNNTSIALSWTQANLSDGTIGGYYIKLDTTTSTLLGATDTSLTNQASNYTGTASNSGSYYFHIAPYATDGTIGATSHFGPIKIDTIAPTISVSPDGGSYTSTQTVTLSSDDSNARIYYTTDGTTPTTSSTRYTSSFNLSSTKTLKAISVDTAGNQSTLKSSQFTITNQNYVAQLDGITEGGTFATTTNGGATTTYTTLTVSGTGVTHYKYKVDTGSYGSQTAKTTPISLSSLAEGLHTIYVVGYDGSTWQSELSPTSIAFTIDNTAPTIVSFSETTGTTITSDKNITLTSNGSSTIYYSLNGGAYSTYSTAVPISSTNNGTLVLKAYSIDLAGNKSSEQTATYSVNIQSSSSSSDASSSTSSTASSTSSTASSTSSISVNNNPTVTTTTTTSSSISGTTSSATSQTNVIDNTTINSGVGVSEIKLTINGQTVTIMIESLLSSVKTEKVADGGIESSGKVTTADGKDVLVYVKANIDGSIDNKISLDGIDTKAKSLIIGSSSKIEADGSIKITIPNINGVSSEIEIKVDGSVIPHLIENGQVIEISETPFPIGSELNIKEVDGKIVINIKAPLKNKFKF